LDPTNLQQADLDALGLTDPVRACHGLHVILGVPVRVHNDARVRRRQVDPKAARAGREKEDEGVRAGAAEAIDGRLAQVAPDGAVQPLV
jgi:hypothetical protein